MYNRRQRVPLACAKSGPTRHPRSTKARFAKTIVVTHSTRLVVRERDKRVFLLLAAYCSRFIARG
jgi:hypothetical protein